MTFYQPMVNFWYNHRCPKCETLNWTYHSHSERHEPIHNPEICTCYNCNSRYWLMSEDMVYDIYGGYETEDGEDLMDVCGAMEATGTPKP